MKTAIIVAGGAGTRMNSSTPKQFLLLNGLPVVMHPLTAFFRFDPSIRLLLALPEQLFDSWKELQQHHNWSIPHEVVPGGKTRFHSVKNCLALLHEEGLVAIHDGARPLLSGSLINRLFSTAEEEGTAIPVVPVNESVRILDGSVSKPADRSRLRVIQTPQIFRISGIKKAYDQSYRPAFTDDATVFESMGNPVHLIDGEPTNMKITHPADLIIAEALADHPV